MELSLRALRIQKGLTQSQLANKLGVTTQTVSSWEKGEYHPRPRFVPLLAKILGVDPHDIFLATNTEKLVKN